ncbi:hypothetical protein SAMN05443549_11119 [Flavobacterium fluvii]|uniref:Uncharacterized protein n=1 Tax=Flavobacterium fluvii TaxID=468056 RepID=A0A1M5PKS8_9FLAO|nr:hypothetical protein [Flavobacterium fluvii]SHH02310.1 hypothetical protein SAMN05443549_11119 [Flavobacterium fluvii]
MKRLLIIGVLLLSSLSYSANNSSVAVDQVAGKEQDSIYKARKTWIEERKYGLIALCNELITAYDFPKTNIEAERDKLKLKVRMYVKEINDVDYSDDKKFAGIQKKFDNIESTFRSYPQKLRERENLKW